MECVRRIGGPDVYHAGAFRHAARQFFAGVLLVDLSRLPLHDGMFKNTF